MFCSLKNGNAIGSFIIAPPEAGEYILKVGRGAKLSLDNSTEFLVVNLTEFILLMHMLQWYRAGLSSHDENIDVKTSVVCKSSHV